MKEIKIFDTTLRDGEQSPHFSLNGEQRITIAKMLEDIGVDIIEVGFPSSSKIELNTIKQISNKIGKSVICVASRLKKEDIDICYEAVKKAIKSRIMLIIPTNLHIQVKTEDLIDTIKNSVKYSRIFFDDIQLAIQDATRIGWENVLKIGKLAVELGVNTLTIADTVGICTPEEFGKLFRDLDRELNKQIVLSAHCHNDLGLAVANSLFAVKNGAGQIEGTILGVGERAGNTPIEELLAIFHLKPEMDFFTNVNCFKLLELCQEFSKISGFYFASNKPVVGEKIFSHKSGIHQKEVLVNPYSFEPYEINTFGKRNRKIILGRHSGLAAVKYLVNTKQLRFSDKVTEKDYISTIKEQELMTNEEFLIE